MTPETNLISVCICTYKRPNLLKRLLEALYDQDTSGLFTYAIVVVDNDWLRSAEHVVADFAAQSPIPLKYCVEPQQNIAMARNRAIANADGHFIACIDDDEFPAKDWLLKLFRACEQYGVDGVLGPVKRHFDEQPPEWIAKGNFYQRRSYPTGHVVEWRKGRTGNLLLRRRVLADGAPPFRSEFRAGEDQDFLRRMIEKGYVFIWCEEAVVYEVVPPIRWRRTFLLRQALLRGASARLQPTCWPSNIAKSMLAVLVYTVVLAPALLLGHHKFMTVLLKLCDHLGKLLAVLGINPIRAPYVTS